MDQSDMNIVLTLIEDSNIKEIRAWKPYPKEFAELDYALRDGGWLDEYHHKPNAKVFAAKYEKELIGFSILCDNYEGTEFRIALKPDKIGKGFGRAITLATMKEAFIKMDQDSIYLIVRLNNLPAKKLYKQIGFIEKNEVIKTIYGKEIRFLKMQYDREQK
jgi:RimJ/RimL family protein N-acetyltransferase